LRTDLVFYSVPYDKILTTVGAEAKVRKLVKNMIYVGVVAQILDIDMRKWRLRFSASSPRKRRPLR